MVFVTRLARRLAVGVGVASVALLGLAGPSNASSVEGVSAATFDTYSSWDGSSFVYPWGHPNTSTYGQTFTVPAGKKKVTQFSFYMASNSGTGDITYRGAIYGWNGTMATNKVFESKKKTISFTAGDPQVKAAKIAVKKAKKLTAGSQYVMFLSVSKDYEETDPNVLSQWAAHYTDQLPGGDVVFINDGGDESQWTTTPWSVFTGYDFAFKATLK